MTGEGPYGLIEDAAIAVSQEKIVWVGPRNDVPAAVAAFAPRDLGGRLVTPARKMSPIRPFPRPVLSPKASP